MACHRKAPGILATRRPAPDQHVLRPAGSLVTGSALPRETWTRTRQARRPGQQLAPVTAAATARQELILTAELPQVVVAMGSPKEESCDRTRALAKASLPSPNPRPTAARTLQAKPAASADLAATGAVPVRRALGLALAANLEALRPMVPGAEPAALAAFGKTWAAPSQALGQRPEGLGGLEEMQAEVQAADAKLPCLPVSPAATVSRRHRRRRGWCVERPLLQGAAPLAAALAAPAKQGRQTHGRCACFCAPAPPSR